MRERARERESREEYKRIQVYIVNTDTTAPAALN